MKLYQLLALFGVLFNVVSGQQYSGFQGASTSLTTPKPSFPPAQVHYVNIGEELGGDYKFGYDTGKTGAGQSFREESRLPDGTVKGAYGYVDAEGKQRIVKYTAGVEGFKVDSDEAAPGSGAPAARPVQTYTPPAQPSYSAAQPAQPNYSAQLTRAYSPSAAPVVQTVPRAYTPAAVPRPVQSYAQPAPRPVPSAPAPSPVASFQPLGGYTPVSNQYSAPKPAALPIPATSPVGSSYNAAQLPTYEDVLKQLQAQPTRPQTPQQSTIPSFTATLRQSQPTYSPRPVAQFAASPQRISSPFQTEPQESTTWGPPVINKELLSYNIGVQG